jgi:hypothetical protein
MSNAPQIEKMYAISKRLNNIVAEMQSRKALIQVGMLKKAA